MVMRLIGAASIIFILSTTFALFSSADATSSQLNAEVQQTRGNRVDQGKTIFRYDTFGDEQLWTDVLRMQDAISTVDPATALAVGLKVDVDALPAEVIAALRAGDVDLNNPAVTIGLLGLNAVVSVKGTVNDAGQRTRLMDRSLIGTATSASARWADTDASMIHVSDCSSTNARI
jgi:hypothetical protein